MSIVFVVNGESMGGGDAGLGAKLLGNFFRTLATLDPKPDAILFYNAGVKALGVGTPHLEALQALDNAGVDLLACVTCLEFFKLTEQMAVGRVSNMRDLCTQMLTASKVVTI